MGHGFVLEILCNKLCLWEICGMKRVSAIIASEMAEIYLSLSFSTTRQTCAPVCFKLSLLPQNI